MVVIDTSVAFKWFKVDEEDYDSAKKILTSHLRQNITIITPELIYYELANAMVTKSSLTNDIIHNNMSLFEKYQIKTIPINFSFLYKVMWFSRKYAVSVYDASYAVLAEENKCDLFTADAKFVKQVNLPYVKLLAEF